LILFADEAGIRSDYHRGTTWGAQGHTPVVLRTGARFSVNMLSAVSAQGDFRFMVHEGTATADTFCQFLRQLIVGMERPIYLIVDGHRIHRAKKVQQLIEELSGKLKLFLLPPYAPQLNPDAWVWNNVKQRVAKQFVVTKAELHELAQAARSTLMEAPETIKGFFRDPAIQYARLTFLSAYSPGLNPDEQVWNHTKARLSQRQIFTKLEMKRHLLSILRSIQKQTSLVKSFFRLPDTAYILHALTSPFKVRKYDIQDQRVGCVPSSEDQPQALLTPRTLSVRFLPIKQLPSSATRHLKRAAGPHLAREYFCNAQ
jgi:transposase